MLKDPRTRVRTRTTTRTIAELLEKPRKPEQERAVVDTQVGEFHASIGQVDEAVLQRDRQVIAQEQVSASAALKIKFESGAEVAIADISGAHAGAEVDERNATSAGSKIVAEQGTAADEISRTGIKLFTSKKLTEDLPISAPPVALRDHAGEDT